MPRRYGISILPDSSHLEAGILEKRPDLPRLVPLHFDRPFPDRASGPQGASQAPRQFLQAFVCDGWREIMDDDHGPAAAVGGLTAENDATHPPGRGRNGGFRLRFRGRKRRKGEVRQRVAEPGESALRGVDFDFLGFFGTHGKRNC